MTSAKQSLQIAVNGMRHRGYSALRKKSVMARAQLKAVCHAARGAAYQAELLWGKLRLRTANYSTNRMAVHDGPLRKQCLL